MRQQRANRVLEPDLLIARLATRQHGVVSIEQLRAAGLSQDSVKRRVRGGRLHRIHRGVYAVGHTALGSEGRWMAAILACGDGALLSHRSAAELWELLPVREGPVDVTIPTAGGRRRREGIRLHRCASLLIASTIRCKGIPVTTPARTISDLRLAASTDEVHRAIREAQFRRLGLGDEDGREPDLTRSKLERRFLRLCRRHRLPRPEVNARVGPFEVDFLWRDRRLIIETDGWQAHGGRLAFEDDRARDVDLKLLGYEVVRFTYRQVIDQPQTVAERLKGLLG
jgi:very-short-patch-repair endonuclease